MQHQEIAAAIAAAVAGRDPQRMSPMLTETVRLRALMPGGAVEARGRTDVADYFCATLTDFDTVDVVGASGEAVGDRVLVHYRLHVTQGRTRWVCTQTAVCTVVDGRLAVVNLLCSGFREIGSGEDAPAVPDARLVG
jgi:hypothetical protein